MELGMKIRQLRTERGLSQEALAHELDVSRQAVTKWESGAALPSTANLLALCELFGISMNELTGGQEPPQPAGRTPRAPLWGALLLGVGAGLAVLTLPAWIFQRSRSLPAGIIGMADGATSIWVTGAPVLLYALTGLAALCAAAGVWTLLAQKHKRGQK